MLDTTDAQLASLIVHQVGNKLRQEPVRLSTDCLRVTDELRRALMSFFFNHFMHRGAADAFRFDHPAGLEQNAAYAIATRIFAGKPFGAESVKLVNHLYDVSDHPRIKRGDVYVAEFDNVRFDGKASRALGIFKADTPNTFLRVRMQANSASVAVVTGTDIKSLDKGALILARDEPTGMRILAGVASREDAAFWSDRFLKLRPVDTERRTTRAYLDLCRAFSTGLPEADGPSGKASFLSRTFTYFADAEHFDESEFTELLDPQQERDRFYEYRSDYEKQHDVRLPTRFDIDDATVRQQKSKFRTLIRLDDCAEIKLLPAGVAAISDVIEKGYDQRRRRHFYKIYFDEER